MTGRIGLRRRSPWLRRTNVGLMVMAVVAVAVVTTVFWPTAAPSPPPTVAFIGDSYVGGSDMGGNGAANLTAVLGQRWGWRSVNAATGGTGYVARRQDAAPFETAQLPVVAAASPTMILVVGSRNDAGMPGIGAAATHLYASLSAAVPRAPLVVVGPIWKDGAPPPQLLRARDEVRDAAGRAGLPFIDPLGEGWFAGDAAGLIGPDGVHPTDAGHAQMAQLLGDDLVGRGLTAER